MRAIGIDIGSRAIKAVLLEDGIVVRRDLVDSGARPLEAAVSLLDAYPAGPTVATGYGRGLLEVEREVRTVTEIKAHGLGAWHSVPGITAVVDIGGQDVKVIALDPAGKVTRFEMNDRCAAGTGRFLEVMAARLGYAIEEFGAAALEATEGVKINSTCTVFAESEVVGLLNRGVAREQIARGLHVSAVAKVVGMYGRVCGTKGAVVGISGGGALNPAIQLLISQCLAVSTAPVENPQFAGALGAAIIASA